MYVHSIHINARHLEQDIDDVDMPAAGSHMKRGGAAGIIGGLRDARGLTGGHRDFLHLTDVPKFARKMRDEKLDGVGEARGRCFHNYLRRTSLHVRYAQQLKQRCNE